MPSSPSSRPAGVSGSAVPVLIGSTAINGADHALRLGAGAWTGPDGQSVITAVTGTYLRILRGVTLGQKVAGGMMVYLGGPRGRKRTLSRGIYLQDPPPGYHAPRPRIPLKERQREAREDWVLLRVTTVILVLVAAAMAVFIALIIAGYR